jgi:hypothetical protein
VCEIALRDSVVLSAVQTVLRMILCLLPPILIIRIFPISQVIRGCLSECLGVINFVEVRFDTGRRVGMICFDFILDYIFVLHQCVVAGIRPSQSLIDMICTPEIQATPALVQGVQVDFFVHMDFASPYRPETCSK